MPLNQEQFNRLKELQGNFAGGDSTLSDRLSKTATEAKDRASSAIRGTGEYEGKSSLNRGFNAAAAVSTGIAKGVTDFAPEPLRKGLDYVGDKAGQGFKAVTDRIADTDLFKGAAQGDTSRLEDTLGIFSAGGEIANTLLAAQGGVKTLSKAKNVTTATASKIKNSIPKIGRGGAAGTAIKDIAEGARRIPNRISVNVAEKQAQRQAIESLPRQSLRNAANEGIDVNDLKTITQIPKAERAPLKKLATVVKDYASGKTKISPESVVGKPIVKRLNTITNQVKGYGKQLDEVANTLKGKAVKARNTVINTVDNTLDTLGVKRGKEGLDFKGSNLEGLGANENIISNVYKRLTEAKDAFDFHRLKKYIDNNVDFGKTGQGFTGESERLLKEWRKYIDTALDTEFSDYNKVNTRLSERIGPLRELKNALKSVDGADVDLLEMGAGLLARRLTSMASSNPKIRQILRNIDKFTSVPGKTSLSVERLQDFYNILDKYYDIAGKTGFQGQIKSGIEKASNVQGYVMDKVTDLAGSTTAVRQKALEAVLEDLFNLK